MKKWIVILVIAAVAGYAGYKKWPDLKAKESAGDTPNRQTTAVVENRDIRFNVNAAGEIGPAEQVSVKPEINGKIELLPVDLGDRVKKGDLLCALDDKELQNEKSSNLTEIERAKLQLQQAERNYKRAQDLFKSTLISQELYENSKTDFDLAKNSLERSQRTLEIVLERLTKTKIVAPFDCTILTRPVSIGQAVSGSAGFNSGTEILTVADLNAMVINAHINQADITRLKSEQEVEIMIEAVAGLKVKGIVERIAPQATIKNNIKGFAVRILLKDPDPRVKPGMTANVKIPVATADNVIAVPLAAVFTEKNPDTSRTERFVYVQKGDGFERRVVQVGISDFFYAEIQSGVAAGEVVALEQPKEEREKIAKAKSKEGGPAAPGAAKPANPRSPGATSGSGGAKTGAGIAVKKAG